MSGLVDFLLGSNLNSTAFKSELASFASFKQFPCQSFSNLPSRSFKSRKRRNEGEEKTGKWQACLLGAREQLELENRKQASSLLAKELELSWSQYPPGTPQQLHADSALQSTLIIFTGILSAVGLEEKGSVG